MANPRWRDHPRKLPHPDWESTLETPVHAQHVRLVSDTNDFFRIYEIALFDRKLDIATDLADFGVARVCREVATERDLLNIHGTFYELPARNAQGLAKVRPVCTHNLAIHDFCSHNGLLLFTGIDADTESDHIFRSADGKAAVWAGVVDDLWKLGKPRGRGGPWHNTKVQPGEPSDPVSDDRLRSEKRRHFIHRQSDHSSGGRCRRYRTLDSL